MTEKRSLITCGDRDRTGQQGNLFGVIEMDIYTSEIHQTVYLKYILFYTYYYISMLIKIIELDNH